MSRALRPILGSALVVLLAVSVAASPRRESRKEPHPKAPPETEQFAFLLGSWDCSIRRMSPDGSLGPADKATWSAEYILDGWAIQDIWTSKLPDGSVAQGTNIRSFNPKTEKWENRWLSGWSLEWKYFESEMVGDTMVMTGGAGTDPRGEFIERNTFHSFTENGWEWRKDRSYDGGETWIEGLATISAKRAGS